MPATERVTYLEARMEELSTTLAKLENALSGLDRKMDRRFDAVELKFGRVDRRIDAVIAIQFGILIAIVAGLFGIATRLL